MTPQHFGCAVLCCSGPSLARFKPPSRRDAVRPYVVAVNGAVEYLRNKGPIDCIMIHERGAAIVFHSEIRMAMGQNPHALLVITDPVRKSERLLDITCKRNFMVVSDNFGFSMIAPGLPARRREVVTPPGLPPKYDIEGGNTCGALSLAIMAMEEGFGFEKIDVYGLDGYTPKGAYVNAPTEIDPWKAQAFNDRASECIAEITKRCPETEFVWHSRPIHHTKDWRITFAPDVDQSLQCSA